MSVRFLIFAQSRDIIMSRRNIHMEILRFETGDILEMKKKHPCGSNRFTVLYAGSDVKLKCRICGHELTCARVKLEKNIRNVISSAEYK